MPLPTPPPSVSPSLPTLAGAGISAGTGGRIPVLVVDDMDDMRALVRLIVRTANDGLVMAGEAANGSEALDLVETLDPAVIVLDELMPGLGGLETARRILARRPHQRIILFSAYLDDRVQDAAREIGITTCLSKVDYESLPDVIRAAAA
jgi:DNA-binding NarL/FixJ family response regulator